MNYRDEREAYEGFLEQRRLEEEAQQRRAAEELARAVFSGHEVRGTTVLGGTPVEPSPGSGVDDAEDDDASGASATEERAIGSADAGAHGIRPSRKRTAGEELYRIIEGHDHDNVVSSLADVEDYDPPGPGSAA